MSKEIFKVGDTFLIPVEITAINEDRPLGHYFLNGCAGIGWWSEEALKDLQKMACSDCRWKGNRHQKCNCCIRNKEMKDCYEGEVSE